MMIRLALSMEFANTLSIIYILLASCSNESLRSSRRRLLLLSSIDIILIVIHVNVIENVVHDRDLGLLSF